MKDSKKSIASSVMSTKILKTLSITYVFDKTLVLPIICNKCGGNDEKIIEQEE